VVDVATRLRQARPRAPGEGARLFLLSFLLLFVELALIRWTTAYVLYLSYFTNFVLLGSFLGIGLGFLRPRPALFRFAPVALAVVVCFVYFVPTKISHAGSALVYFGAHTGGAPIWLALPGVFAVVTVSLMLIAGRAAQSFATLPPLSAYRYDILGSICGTALFAILSLAGAPPLVWGLFVAAVVVAVSGRTLRPVQLLGLVAMLVPFGLASFHSDLIWSPYYAIALQKEGPGETRVSVNGIPHQTIAPLKLKVRQGSYYSIPYSRLHGNTLRDVLVIGAGDGTDVSVALAHHAQRVDAVEIDPDLLQLGRTRNTDRPYANPRVHAHVTDGRAFLQQTHRTYDLIVFALPDSLTLVANQSSLRLESYLFTLQAFQEARKHLNADGAFAMYNFYRQQWLVDRFANTLDRAFGHPPCIDEQFGRGALLGPVADLVDARSTSYMSCRKTWSPGADPPAPATDDHPFPYLRTPSLPGFYLLTLGLILAAALVGIRAAGARVSTMRPYADLFCMGAAFLLLETKSVVQFALLFGTTWLVNALVFLAVLVAVLLAIETAQRIRRDIRGYLYPALLAALAAAWIVPSERLLDLSFWPRLLAASALAFAPVFLANLVFAERFRGVAASTTAFGANLLGALVGGLAEYSSLVIGYRALLPVVAGLYAVAFALERVRAVALAPR